MLHCWVALLSIRYTVDLTVDFTGFVKAGCVKREVYNKNVHDAIDICQSKLLFPFSFSPCLIWRYNFGFPNNFNLLAAANAFTIGPVFVTIISAPTVPVVCLWVHCWRRHWRWVHRLVCRIRWWYRWWHGVVHRLSNWTTIPGACGGTWWQTINRTSWNEMWRNARPITRRVRFALKQVSITLH